MAVRLQFCQFSEHLRKQPISNGCKHRLTSTWSHFDSHYGEKRDLHRTGSLKRNNTGEKYTYTCLIRWGGAFFSCFCSICSPSVFVDHTFKTDLLHSNKYIPASLLLIQLVNIGDQKHYGVWEISDDSNRDMKVSIYLHSPETATKIIYWSGTEFYA